MHLQKYLATLTAYTKILQAVRRHSNCGFNGWKWIKGRLVNTVRELLMTVEEIKIKTETDDFIMKMKNQERFKENKTDLPWCNLLN